MKIYSEDFSFENLFIEIYPLKINLGDFFLLKFRRFILWNFVFRIFFLLKICLGDLSFWNFVRRFVIWKKKLGDLSFEKFVTRFVLLKILF